MLAAGFTCTYAFLLFGGDLLFLFTGFCTQDMEEEILESVLFGGWAEGAVVEGNQSLKRALRVSSSPGNCGSIAQGTGGVDVKSGCTVRYEVYKQRWRF